MFILVPPRAAVHYHHKHHALLVPEILLIIFKYITNDSEEPLLSTLAALARTCRVFQPQAEGILWYKIPDISILYNILPPQVRKKEAWTLNRRMLSGTYWTRFMDLASRVRIIVEDTSKGQDRNRRCSAIFLAIAAFRRPVLLTPHLRKLEWQIAHPSLDPVINLLINPSLQSLEIDVRLVINHDICAPLGSLCPRLQHLKITGNGRSACGTISRTLRSLHLLETVACSSLDNDAFIHLAQLKKLVYLAVDMRWSVLNFDMLRDRLCLDSFPVLQSLCWKDYDLGSLADLFLMPDIPLSIVRLEIESFCTSSSLRTFLHSLTAKFPHTHVFSLVHDVGASRRFGLQASAPGREHQLATCDLKPLFSLKSLRALTLMDLGDLRLDDGLVKAIASSLPALEQLHLGTEAMGSTPTVVTFEGLLTLLQHCPKLHTLGLLIDAQDMLSFSNTGVCHSHLMHLRLKGSILGSRRAEVDEMLRQVLPGLKMVEESLDGVTQRVRSISTVQGEDDANRTPAGDGRSTGRRTRNSH